MSSPCTAHETIITGWFIPLLWKQNLINMDLCFKIVGKCHNFQKIRCVGVGLSSQKKFIFQTTVRKHKLICITLTTIYSRKYEKNIRENFCLSYMGKDDYLCCKLEHYYVIPQQCSVCLHDCLVANLTSKTY